MNGEVLGHVPTAPSKARKHEKSLFKGGDFWWRVGGRIASNLILGFGAKRVGEDGFWKEDDEREGRLTNSNSKYKPFSPSEVAGNYKFAIESTHEVQKIRKM